MKNYKNYIINKKKIFNTKVKLIAPIIDFMIKFKLEYLIISYDYNNYHYEEIFYKNNSFILLYQLYEDILFDGPKQTEYQEDLFDLDINFLTNLMKVLQDRLDELFIFEIYKEYDIILNAFKVSKKKIKLNKYVFLEWLDEDDFKINSYEFQKTMFSTHPEVFDTFMDAIDQNIKNINKNKYNYNNLILHPKIKKEFNSLYQKYKKNKKSKKFNI